MSDLSERLSVAATLAIHLEFYGGPSDEWPWDEWEPEAKAAAVAVLRLLADDAEERGNAANETALAKSGEHRAHYLGKRDAEFNAAFRFRGLAKELYL
jgi:hypothetical protein